MIRIVVLVCFLLSCIALRGQPARVMDSLKAIVDSHPAHDTVRVRALYQYMIATLYNSTNNKPYLDEMLALSRKLDYRFGERKALIMHVKYYGDRTDFPRSFAYADSLFTLLEGDSSYFARRDRGILFWDLANNYFRIGDYDKSLSYYLSAVGVFEKLGDQNYASSLYSRISGTYEKTGDTLRSMDYAEKALDAAKESTSENVRCTAAINHISALIDRRRFQEAATALDELEPLVLRLENAAYSQYFFYCKGLVARFSNDCPTAIRFFYTSLRFARETSDPHSITSVMMELFHCLSAVNSLSSAKLYLDSVLVLASEAGLKSRRKEVYDGLADWHEKTGDFRNASFYLRKAIALNDSILSEEKNREIASLETRYQVEAKETEIRNLKTEQELQRLSIRQKNITNYWLIGATITILTIFLLSYKNYRHKQRLQHQRISELETEKKIAAVEAVLRGEEQERTRLSKDLHDGLGGMLAGIKHSFNNMKGNLIMTPENQQAFERSMDMLDSSIKEMRRVAHNMMPEALVRFGLDTALKDYCSDINQSGALHVTYQSIGIDDVPIDATTSITIYRIVQELITNTMKHAGAKNAIVQLARTNGVLSATIEDDGKGFDTSILAQPKGIGWANIQHRVNFLKGKLDLNSEPGKGTSVHIEFNA